MERTDSGLAQHPLDVTPGEGVAGGLEAGPSGPVRNQQGLSGVAAPLLVSGPRESPEPSSQEPGSGSQGTISQRTTSTDPRRGKRVHGDGECERGELAVTETASGSGGRATYAVELRATAAGGRQESTAVETLKPAKKPRPALDDSEAELEFEDDQAEKVEEATGAQAPEPTSTPIPAEARSTAQLAMARLRERVRRKQRLAEEEALEQQRHGDVAAV